MERRRERPSALAGATLASAALTACFFSLPERPASLKQLGVRVGANWLQKAQLYEDARLGSVTQIVKRVNSGEIAIVGTHAAVFLPGKQNAPRVVTFAEPAGHAELIEWPIGEPRYLDRGGGGWQTGAVIGADGKQLWQPDHGMGMDDLAAGDLDGDGVPEFAVGYNGGGGVRLLDASGKERWHESDGNVWHVEIVDTDGDGKPEVVHSNASGQLTVRGPGGKVLMRGQVESYVSHFSVVEWPSRRIGLLHAIDAGTDVLDFDGKVRTHLETPDTGILSEAEGTAVRFAREDYLAFTVSERNWDRTQIFVFDPRGTLRYREVASAECAAIGVAEADAFLLGCGNRVFRYTMTRRVQP